MYEIKYFIRGWGKDGHPVGTIRMALSERSNKPESDAEIECDGRFVDRLKYRELHMMIGDKYSPPRFITQKMKWWRLRKLCGRAWRVIVNNPEYSPTHFRVPDLRARFLP